MKRRKRVKGKVGYYDRKTNLQVAKGSRKMSVVIDGMTVTVKRKNDKVTFKCDKTSEHNGIRYEANTLIVADARETLDYNNKYVKGVN